MNYSHIMPNLIERFINFVSLRWTYNYIQTRGYIRAFIPRVISGSKWTPRFFSVRIINIKIHRYIYGML